MKPPQQDINSLIGKCVYLASRSPLHNSYTIGTFTASFLPGISLNQFRYFERNGQPLGIAVWAWLTDEVSEQYAAGGYMPPAEEWNQGKNLWFMEFLSPFDATEAMLEDLCNGIFKDDIGRGIKRNDDGSIRTIKKYYGVEALRKAREKSNSKNK